MNPEPQPLDSSDESADLQAVAQLVAFLQSGGPIGMDCRELLEVVARYVDLEATGAEPADWMPGVDLHAEDCDHCHELVDVLRQLTQQRPSLDQDLETVWEQVRLLAGAGEPGLHLP